jgi:hypothetical protein
MFQGLVQRQEVRTAIGRRYERLVERHVRGVAAALICVAPAGRLHEDTAHQLRGHREEVVAALPVDACDVDQAQVRFVDERGRLERMVRAFVPHVAMRDAPKFSVDEG